MTLIEEYHQKLETLKMQLIDATEASKRTSIEKEINFLIRNLAVAIDKEFFSEEILRFYLKTSLYTDLGLYRKWLANYKDPEEIARLIKSQLVHSFAAANPIMRKSKNTPYGDMSKIESWRLSNEEPLFPTAIGMLAELLRKDPELGYNREAKNKIHVACRGHAVFLTAILKAILIPARVRAGFAKYVDNNGLFNDHFISEYFDENSKSWIYIDADSINYNLPNNVSPANIPPHEFLSAAQAWLMIRNQEIDSDLVHNYSGFYGLEAALIALMNDFHCLMSNEKPFYFSPRFLDGKNESDSDNNKINADVYNYETIGFKDLSNLDIEELDKLALLMETPNKNFTELKRFWEENPKYRKLKGVLNWEY